MRWFLWKLGWIDLVYTYYNGDKNDPHLRVVHYDGEGKKFVMAISGEPDTELLPDGQVKHTNSKHHYLNGNRSTNQTT